MLVFDYIQHLYSTCPYFSNNHPALNIWWLTVIISCLTWPVHHFFLHLNAKSLQTIPKWLPRQTIQKEINRKVDIVNYLEEFLHQDEHRWLIVSVTGHGHNKGVCARSVTGQVTQQKHCGHYQEHPCGTHVRRACQWAMSITTSGASTASSTGILVFTT